MATNKISVSEKPKANSRTKAGSGAKAQPKKPPLSDSQIIRRQLIIIASVMGLIVGGWGLWKWGEETGWGNSDRAVQIKMERAQRSVVDRQFAQAVEDYSSILDRYPQHASAVQAMTGLAGAYESLHNFESAVGVYQNLLARLQSDPTKKDLGAFTQLQIAKLQKERGLPDEALAAFQAVRLHYPDTDWAGEAQSGIGQVYQARGDYVAAIEAYKVVIKELPRGFLAAEAQGRIGECYESDGDIARAIAAYDAVVKNYPSAVWDQAKDRMKALEKRIEEEKKLR